MKPLVSIIIPTYNHAHLIDRALQSVLCQTYTHWEALVVDNHSRDNTDAVIKSFGDPRIHLLKIHNNGVIAESRNLGMRKARGEFVAFLDSDDLWYAGKLDVIMKNVENDSSYDVWCHDEWMVNDKKEQKSLLHYGPYQKDFYKRLLVEGNCLSTSATVVRRDFIVRHDLAFNTSPNYATVEDYGFWLDLARAGARFMFIRDIQGEYIIHDTNVSADLQRHLKNGENLLRNHVFNIQKFEPSPVRLWRRVSARLNLARVYRLIKEKQFRMSFWLALKTLIEAPNSVVTCLLLKLKRQILTQ